MRVDVVEAARQAGTQCRLSTSVRRIAPDGMLPGKMALRRSWIAYPQYWAG
jgi:hypothetical protein